MSSPPLRSFQYQLTNPYECHFYPKEHRTLSDSNQNVMWTSHRYSLLCDEGQDGDGTARTHWQRALRSEGTSIQKMTFNCSLQNISSDLPLRMQGASESLSRHHPECYEETLPLQRLNASSDMNLNVVLRLTQIQGHFLNKMPLGSSLVRERGGESCCDSHS